MPKPENQKQHTNMIEKLRLDVINRDTNSEIPEDFKTLFSSYYNPITHKDLLHIAIKNNDIKMVDFLLSSEKVKLDHVDEYGITALHVALYTNKENIVRKLLLHAAKEKYCIRLLFETIYRNPKEEVSDDFQAIFAKYYAPYYPFKKGTHSNLLHIAIKNNDMKMIEFLLSKRIDLELKDADGKTALDIAIDNKNSKAAYAIYAASSVDSEPISDRNQINIERLNQYNKAYETYEKALQGGIASINLRELSETDLHFMCCMAVINKNQELIKALKGYDPKIMTSTCNYGGCSEFSPMDLELFLSNDGCLSSLQKKVIGCIRGKVLEAHDFQGFLTEITPFYESKLLQERIVTSADITAPKNQKQHTNMIEKLRLDVINRDTNSEIPEDFKTLFSSYYNPITHKDLLHIAIKNNDIKMVDFLLSSEKVKLDHVDEYGNTALDIALYTDKENIVSKLLPHRPDANEELDQNKSTACFGLLCKTIYRNPKEEVSGDFQAIFAKYYDPYYPFKKGTHSNLLHIAIKNNDMKMIEFLLSKRIDLELKDADGKTALDIAIDLALNNANETTALNNKTIAIMLRRNGAAVNEDKLNTLEKKIQKRKPNATVPTHIKTLLEIYYAKGNPCLPVIPQKLFSIAKDRDNELRRFLLSDKFPTESSSALISYIKNIESRNVMQFFKNNDTTMNSLDSRDVIALDAEGKNTLEILARISMNLDSIKKDNEDRAVIIEGRINNALKLISRFWFSELNYAMRYYNCTKIKQLINLLNSGTKDFQNELIERLKCQKIKSNSRNLLHLAAQFNDQELIDMLGEYDIPRTLSDLGTPLHVATKYGNSEAITTLLKLYPELIYDKEDSLTALDLAIKKGDEKMVNEIVKSSCSCLGSITYEDISVDTNTKITQGTKSVEYQYGDTPLHLAVKLGNKDLALNILDKYPDMIKCTNKDGNTPLDEAISSNNPELINPLINKANIDPKFTIKQNINGNEKNFLSAMELLFARKLELYIERKNKTYYINSSDDTLLHEIVKSNLTEKIKELYDIDNNILYAQNSKGETALHVAVKNNNIEGIQKLLELDRENKLRNIQDKNHNTALDIAIDNKNSKAAYAIYAASSVDSVQISDRNQVNIEKLKKYKKEYETYEKVLQDGIASINLRELNETVLNFMCCMAVINKNQELIKALKGYDPKIMTSTCNYGGSSEFSPMDLKLFLSNDGCLSSLRKEVLRCFGRRNLEAHDLQGFLTEITPFYESKLLQERGVTIREVTVSTIFVTSESRPPNPPEQKSPYTPSLQIDPLKPLEGPRELQPKEDRPLEPKREIVIEEIPKAEREDEPPSSPHKGPMINSPNFYPLQPHRDDYQRRGVGTIIGARASIHSKRAEAAAAEARVAGISKQSFNTLPQGACDKSII